MFDVAVFLMVYSIFDVGTCETHSKSPMVGKDFGDVHLLQTGETASRKQAMLIYAISSRSSLVCARRIAH